VPPTEFGHRILPHRADLVIEAWAPTQDGCFAQAVHALVDTFADTSRVVRTRPLPLRLDPAEDAELLVALLDGVVHLIGVLGEVPVAAVVHRTDDGGLGGSLDVAPLRETKRVGALPRGIPRAEVGVAGDDVLWTCRAVVAV
jgi:SHS2 domain-containing protein